MRAVVFTEYGAPEVLRPSDVAQPVLRAQDVLVRVRATSVNFGDLLVRNFRAVTPGKFHMPLLFWIIGRVGFGYFKPRIGILGSEFVRLFKEGDPVFGYCGPRMGAYAEYVRMPENGIIAAKP